MRTEFRAEMPVWDDRINLFVRVTDGAGKRSFGRPLALEVIPEGNVVWEPTMRIDKTDAQQFMDELWRIGIRPSEGSGSAGSLAATERHLADMKAIAMSALRKTGIAI